MGRRAVTQGFHEETEAMFDFGFGETENLEDAPLKIGVVDSDRTAAEFEAVEDQIVMLSAHRVGITLKQHFLPGRGRGERVMRGDERTGLGVAFKERKTDDPAERELLRIAQAEPFADVQA